MEDNESLYKLNIKSVTWWKPIYSLIYCHVCKVAQGSDNKLRDATNTFRFLKDPRRTTGTSLSWNHYLSIFRRTTQPVMTPGRPFTICMKVWRFDLASQDITFSIASCPTETQKFEISLTATITLLKVSFPYIVYSWIKWMTYKRRLVSASSRITIP